MNGFMFYDQHFNILSKLMTHVLKSAESTYLIPLFYFVINLSSFFDSVFQHFKSLSIVIAHNCLKPLIIVILTPIKSSGNSNGLNSSFEKTNN